MRVAFNYNPENGRAEVVLKKQGITSSGTAKVHPDDRKYASEYTGLTIAEMRAYKKFLEKRARKKNKIEKQLLNQAEYYKKLAEEDIEVSKRIQEDIEYYIQSKANFYAARENPATKINWSDLDESRLSDNFKKALE